MSAHKLECRRPSFIKAERLEELVWNEVKRMVQHPGLIVAGIESLNTPEDDGWEKEIAGAERDLNRVQAEEDRAIRLYVSGKIIEVQLDHQCKFITERLETLRTELDDYRAQQRAMAEKRVLMENIVAPGPVRLGTDQTACLTSSAGTSSSCSSTRWSSTATTTSVSPSASQPRIWCQLSTLKQSSQYSTCRPTFFAGLDGRQYPTVSHPWPLSI